MNNSACSWCRLRVNCINIKAQMNPIISRSCNLKCLRYDLLHA